MEDTCNKNLPPRPVHTFTSTTATEKNTYHPAIINKIIAKHAAGLNSRPTAEQIKNLMETEQPIDPEHYYAIQDTLNKLTGEDLYDFLHNCGSSIKGLANLIHKSLAYHPIICYYVDQFSDRSTQQWPEFIDDFDN